MKIKKIIAVLLAAVLLCAVTSCGKDEVLDTDGVFTAVEKTATLESYKLSYDVTMRMTHEDEYIDTVVNGTTEVAVVDGERVSRDFAAMDYGESKLETELYVVGDIAYLTSGGQKIKIPTEYATTGVPTIELSLIKREAFESVTKNEDGFYTVTVKEDSLKEFIATFLGAEENVTTVYKDITLSFKVEDGYVSEGKFGFTMATSDDDIGDYGTTTECVFVFEEPGTAVNITLPDDAEYIDAMEGTDE